MVAPDALATSRRVGVTPATHSLVAARADGLILIPPLRICTQRAVQPWVQLGCVEVGDIDGIPAVGAGVKHVERYSGDGPPTVETTSNRALGLNFGLWLI